MACDIHTYVERKVDGVWEVVPDFHPFEERCYFMFGLFAGVRCDWAPAIYDYMRGFPPGMSKEVRDEYDKQKGLGLSGCSYLDAEDLLSVDYFEVVDEDETVEANLPWNYLGDYIDFMLVRSKAEDARLVFWFDN